MTHSLTALTYLDVRKLTLFMWPRRLILVSLFKIRYWNLPCSGPVGVAWEIIIICQIVYKKILYNELHNSRIFKKPGLVTSYVRTFFNQFINRPLHYSLPIYNRNRIILNLIKFPRRKWERVLHFNIYQLFLRIGISNNSSRDCFGRLD